MSYVNFEIDFKFKTINQLELIKVGPNHLKIMADFGSVYYQNIEYRIYDAHFKYPSEHRVIFFITDFRLMASGMLWSSRFPLLALKGLNLLLMFCLSGMISCLCKL